MLGQHDPAVDFLTTYSRPLVSIPTTNQLSYREDWFVTVLVMTETRRQAGSLSGMPLNSHSARPSVVYKAMHGFWRMAGGRAYWAW